MEPDEKREDNRHGCINNNKKFGLEQAFKYLHKDPEKNLVKIMDWADKFAGNEFVPQRRMIREAMTNPKHPYYGYIRHILEDIDPHVM